MIYGWIIGGLAALDLGVKSVVEGQGGRHVSKGPAVCQRIYKAS